MRCALGLDHYFLAGAPPRTPDSHFAMDANKILISFGHAQSKRRNGIPNASVLREQSCAWSGHARRAYCIGRHQMPEGARGNRPRFPRSGVRGRSAPAKTDTEAQSESGAKRPGKNRYGNPIGGPGAKRPGKLARRGSIKQLALRLRGAPVL